MIRTVGRTSTQTPPDVLSEIILPVFSGEPIDRDALTMMIDLMVQYKVIPAKVDLDTAIAAQG
jgi:hypothetical protein